MFFRSVGSVAETGPVLIWSLIRIGLDTDLGTDRSNEKFFDGAKICQKLDRVAAIVFVQESSKSEPSSRFLSRLKFEKSTRHFWANSGDRPGICANLIRIRTNPGTIGRIHKKVPCVCFHFLDWKFSHERKKSAVVFVMWGRGFISFIFLFMWFAAQGSEKFLEKNSNGRKIARMALIWTKICQNRSRRLILSF